MHQAGLKVGIYDLNKNGCLLGGDFDFKHFKMLNSPGSARRLHRQNIDRWIMIVSNL